MWAQLAAGARAFLPTQFGLSFFIWDGGCYNARTFNFFVFPAPSLYGHDKRFMCQVCHGPTRLDSQC